MRFVLFILQIGDLFRGEFNWRGVFHLFLFFLMAAVVVGIGGFMIANAFKSKDK